MPPAPDDAGVPTTSGRRWTGVILAGVLAVHVVQAAGLFPSFEAFWDPQRPVIVVDHAIHLYHGALGSRFLLEHGTTWGFDPFFMAGYPETPVWDSSSNLSILFQALAGGGYHPRAYKVGLLVCTMLTVALVPLGVRAAGLGRGEAAAAAALVGFYFWVGFPGVLWRTGLFAFVLASSATVLVLGLALRFDRRPAVGRWAVLAAAGAALLFTHVTAPLLVAGGGIGFLAATARRRGGRGLLAPIAAAAVAVAANLIWLVPLWRFRGIRSGIGGYMSPSSAWFLVDLYGTNPIDGHLGLFFLIAGAAGMVLWWADGRRVQAATFGGTVAALLALTAFGGLWGATRALEPFRFYAPLQIVLAVPAGSALVRVFARLARAGGGGRRGAALAAVVGLAVLGATAALQPQLFEVCARQLTRPRPLVVGLRPEMQALVRWIRAETDPSARILFEDQLRLLEPTDPESVHWTPLLPVLLDPDARSFIGGLYQTAFIAHHRFASFGDYQLGGRPLNTWTTAGVEQYCEQYNVGWVVCWSPLSRSWFDRFGPAQRVATLPRYSSPVPISPPSRFQWMAIAARAGPEVATRYLLEGERQYALYRIDRPRSYFLRGRGTLTAVDFNRIELTDVVPDGGAVVLSLHGLDTWRTDPPLPLASEPVPDDPVPFVRMTLPGPLPRIVLYNAYGRP